MLRFSYILIIFIDTQFSNFIQAQDSEIKTLYLTSKYQKCISKSEATLQKDSKFLDAYLYQALSYIKLKEIPKYAVEYKASSEKSLRLLKNLKKKDKDSSYQSAHTTEIQFILENARKTIQEYRSKNKIFNLISLYDLLLQVDYNPEEKFEKTKWMLSSDDKKELTEIDTAISQLYKKHCKGAKIDTCLISSFVWLTDYLLKNGLSSKAVETYNKAFEFFGKKNQLKISLVQSFKTKRETSLQLADSIIELIDLAIKVLDAGNDLVELKCSFMDTIIRKSYNPHRYNYNNGVYEYGYYYGKNGVKYDTLIAKLLNIIKRASFHSESFHKQTEIEMDSILINYIELSILNNNDSAQKLYFKMFVDVKSRLQNNSNYAQIISDAVGNKNCTKNFLFRAYAIKYLKANYPKNNNIEKYLNELVLQIINEYNTAICNYETWQKIFFFNDFLQGNLKLKNHEISYSKEFISGLIHQKNYSLAIRIINWERKRYPENKNILELKRQLVIADYNENYLTSNVNDELLAWTGAYKKCIAGRISDTAQILFLKRLNYFRRLAGLPDDCILSDTLNYYCQKAALIMAASDDLSHNPDGSWKCFSMDGQTGASHSNLGLGYHSTSSLSGQIRDDGLFNTSVGHRRWILLPNRRVFGHGSTDNSMSLWTLSTSFIDNQNYSDSLMSAYSIEYVTFPPADYSPMEFNHYRWSFSMTEADFSKAKVEVYYNGKAVNVRIELIKQGYGLNSIVWTSGLTFIQNDKEPKVKVKISNVDHNKNYEYTVTFLRI